jgi:uncharacterized membrane protein
MPTPPTRESPASIIAQDKETGRVEAFSDGVFAIAITLLILDVRVPRVGEHDPGTFDLAHELVRLWPALLAYVMSFASILVMWVNHHMIFTIVRRADRAFLFWNGLLLMFVTFVPFPTALLSEYMGHGSHEELRLAAMVYASHGLLIALAFTAVWRYAVTGGRLLTPGHMEVEVRHLSERYRYGPLAYLIAIATSAVLPWGGVAICFALAAFYAVRGFTGRG